MIQESLEGSAGILNPINGYKLKHKKNVKDQLRTLDMDEGRTVFKGAHIKRQLESQKQIVRLCIYLILEFLIISPCIPVPQDTQRITHYEFLQNRKSLVYLYSDCDHLAKPIRSSRLHYDDKASFQDIHQRKLEIGDFILLKKDEICVADIIVLACGEDKCIVETTEIEGFTDFKIVKPVSSTNEENISIPTILRSYKYTLSGKIEYYPIKRDEKTFQGYIKLESDPKGENITFQNIINRGSFLRNTDWVLGIVVEYGYLNTQLSVKQVKIARDKYIMKFMNRFIQMTTIWISFAIFSNIFWKNIHSQSEILSNAGNKSQITLILESIVVYSQGVPVLLYTIVHASYNFVKYQLEKKYESEGEKIKINNAGAITNLSHADIAVFSLSGAFIKSNNEDIVQGVYLNNNTFYTVGELSLNREPSNKQSMKNQQEDDFPESPYQGPIQYSPNINASTDKVREISGLEKSPGTRALKLNDIGQEQISNINNNEFDFSDEDHHNNGQSGYDESDPDGSHGKRSIKLSELRRGTQDPNKQELESSDDSDDSDPDDEDDEEDGSENNNHVDEEKNYQTTINPQHIDIPWNSKNKFFHPYTVSTPPRSPSLINQSDNYFFIAPPQLFSNLHSNNTSFQIHFQPPSQGFFHEPAIQLNNNSNKNNNPLSFPSTEGKELSVLVKKDFQPDSMMSQSLKQNNVKKDSDSTNINYLGFSRGSNTTPLVGNGGGNETDFDLRHPISLDPLSKKQNTNSNQSSKSSSSGTIKPKKKKTLNQQKVDSNNPSFNNFDFLGTSDALQLQKHIHSAKLSSDKSESININHRTNNNPLNLEKNTNNNNTNASSNSTKIQPPLLQISNSRKLSANLPLNSKYLTPILLNPANVQRNNPHIAKSTGGTYIGQSVSLTSSPCPAPGERKRASVQNVFLPIRDGPSQSFSQLQNRSFNQFTSPNHIVGQLNQTQSHSSFQFQKSYSYSTAVTEISKWAELSLIQATSTKPPKLDDKLNATQLFSIIDQYSPSEPSEFANSVNFFKALALCHNVKTKKIRREKEKPVNDNTLKDHDHEKQPVNLHENTLEEDQAEFKYEPLSKDEEAQFYLCEKSGIQFLSGGSIKNKLFYDLLYKNKTIRYEVKATILPDEKRQFFGVIVKADDTQLTSLLPPTTFSQFNNTKYNHNNNTNIFKNSTEDASKILQIENLPKHSNEDENKQTKDNSQETNKPATDNTSNPNIMNILNISEKNFSNHAQPTGNAEKINNNNNNESILNNTNTYEGSSNNLNRAQLSGMRPAKSLKRASGAQTLAQFINTEPRDLQLFIRGTAAEILPRCNLSKFQIDSILKDLQTQQSKGLRTIFFARKIIEKNDKNNDIDENARNMEFLGAICLLQQLVTGANQLVELFQQAGMLNWLLSGDSQNRVVSAAYQSQMITHETTLLTIDQTNVEELKYQVKIRSIMENWMKNHLFLLQNIILDEDEYNPVQEGSAKLKEVSQSVRSITKEQFKRRMSNMNNARKGSAMSVGNDQEKLDKIALLVDGNIFNLLLSNDYLKSHFQFLCLACSSVLGYNFSQRQKAHLIKLIQDIGSEKTTFVSFGYGSKDSYMLNQSNFSFQLDGQSTCQRNIGDIIIQDFSLVRRLVLEDSIQISDMLQYLVVTNTKLIIFIMFFNYFFQLHNYQIQAGLINGYQIILNIYISQTVGSLYIILSSFGHGAQNCMIQLRPEFYRFRRIQSSWIKSHFIDCMLFAAIHAFTASLLVEDPLMSNDSTDGRLIDYENAQGVISFVMGLIFIFIIMAGPMKHKLINSIVFIIIQIGVSLAPSLLKVALNWSKFSQPFIFKNLFTIWEAFAIVFIMTTVFTVEKYFTNYFRYFILPKQFLKVFEMHSLKFYPERFKGFQDQMRRIIKEVRLSPEFLSSLLSSLFANTEIDPFLRKILDPASKVDSNQDIHKITLEFKDKSSEKAYREYRYDIINRKFIIIVLLIASIFTLQTLGQILTDQTSDMSDNSQIFFLFLLYSRILGLVLMVSVCLILLVNEKLIHIIPSKFIKIFFYYFLPFIILNITIYIIGANPTMDMLANVFLLSTLNWDAIPPPLYFSLTLCFIYTVSTISSILRSDIFILPNGDSPTKNKIICLIAFLGYSLNSFFYYFANEKSRRNAFSTKNRIKYEENTVDHVLANLLPPFVRTRFNTSGNTSIEEDQGDVAILFFDICDFDNILLEEKGRLIKWVDNLYRLFDKICVEYGVQKIETVGKIYMACAGLKLTKEERVRQQKMVGDNETKRLLLAAQEMQTKAKSHYWSVNKSTYAKIGIHYGKVIAGVIGAHKPQFSLIGDTVNTASRVCSNSKTGRISLSQEAHLRIGKTEWLFIEREVEAKGKGVIKIYSLAENIKNTIIKVNNTTISNKNNTNEKIPQRNHQHSIDDGLKLTNMQNNNNNSPNVNNLLHINLSDLNHQSNKSSQDKITLETKNNPRIFPSVQNNLKKTQLGSNGLIDLVEQSDFPFTVQSSSNIGRKYSSPRFNNQNFAQAFKETQKATLKNNGGSTFPSKRKASHSTTMVVAPRNNLRNHLAVQKLEDLEIPSEECLPERAIYEEEDKTIIKSGHSVIGAHKFHRQESIMQKKTNTKGEKDSGQEPMLQVSRILLSYQNGRDDVVQRFELSNSIECSGFLSARCYIIQAILHALVFITVFVNLPILVTNQQILALALKAAQSGMVVILVVLLPKLSRKLGLFKLIIHVYFLYSHMTSIIFAFFFRTNEGILITLFIEHLTLLNLSQNSSVVYFNRTLHFSGIMIGFWTYMFHYIGRDNYVWKIVVLVIFEIYKCYISWERKIDNFNNLVAHEIKKLEKDNLLKYLVPKHILTQFLQNKKQYQEISETLEKVTLLFADIAGFTSYSSNKQPSEVVKMLRNLFTSFDQLCLKHKVYKVYTIGDCYVVLGTIDKYNRSYHEECANVVKMGFSMIQVIESIKREHKDFGSVNMRIGIHLGEKILGGIIGTNIVRYDIFGKDVVIANKMESNGFMGKVNVSEDTKKFLENHFPNEYKFEENKEVELSNFKQEDGQSLKVNSFFIEQGDFDAQFAAMDSDE